MGSVGFREILIVLLIILILFGAKRIPELMRSMGKGINEFKGGLKGDPPTNEDKKQEPKV
jgi:sec-independent protein translocase protein TatA